MKTTKTTALFLRMTLISSLGISANAASIDWGLGAQNITGASDVSTIGDLVDAFNLGASGVQSTTVNGVTFSAFVFPNFTGFTVTSGNYNFTEDFGVLTAYNNLGYGSGDFSALPTSYQTLLSSAGSSDLPTTLSLTISGLDIGTDYLFQFWVNNANTSVTTLNGQGFSTTATADNNVSLDDNTSNANGGLGQFVIGTFTADDTEQVIAFNGIGADDPTINAFQVRAVPEPASWMMIGMGGWLFGLVLRHNRNKEMVSSR